MPARLTTPIIAATLAVACLLLLGAVVAQARSITWSGYGWDVRPSEVGGPGPNAWSDSEANVRVEGTDLVLSDVQDGSGTWTSAELDGQRHLGYGTYRWVVASDLSTLDAHEVLGMFTYGGGGPSNNEIDIEPSHWGNLSWATGSATAWQDAEADLSRSKTFNYTARPPYVNQFTWEPDRITYLVRDADGRTLLDWTVTSGVPVPSSEVPVTNYWRYRNVAPSGPRSVRLSSFAWVPPGHEGELPPLPSAGQPLPAAAAAPTGATTTAAPPSAWRCGLRSAARTATAGRQLPRASWTATGDGRLRIAVLRRRDDGHLVPVGALSRAVRAGSGSLRFSGRLHGRRLGAGRYRLVLTVRSDAGQVRCGPARLAFTQPAR